MPDDCLLAPRIQALASEHAPRFSVAVLEESGTVTITLEHPASNASQVLGWGDATLGEVTAMLVEAGALTEHEGAWLRATSAA